MFILFAFVCSALAGPSGLYIGDAVSGGNILTIRIQVKSNSEADLLISWKGITYNCPGEPYTLSSSNVITFPNVDQDDDCVKKTLDATGAQLTGMSYRPIRDQVTVSLTYSVESLTVVLYPPATPHGGGGADPHFHLFNKKHISYHGECDLVLLSCPDVAADVSLDIQIRTTIKSSYSLIQGVAMMFANEHFEMAGKDKYYVNNKFQQEPPAEFAGYRVQKLTHAPWCKDKCLNATIFKFHFGHYGTVELCYWNGFLHVEARGPAFDKCTGLLGRSSKPGLVARNGTVMEDVNQYGQEWQVSNSEINLFRFKRQPQYPDRCILPKQTSRRRIGLSNHLMAVKACSHLSGPVKDMCIFDVQATGDELMAYAPMFG